MDYEFKFEGLEELNKTFKNLAKSMDPDKVEPVFKKGASIIAAAIRRKAPKGPTKNLYKSVRVKKLARRGNQPSPYIAAIDRKKAPHAHLVIEGSKGVRIGKKGSRKYRDKKFGIMPANQFFDDAVKEKETQAVNGIIAGLKKLVEEAVK